MTRSRTTKRRAAGVASAKILITSASLVATVGGWAAISALDRQTSSAQAQADAAIPAPPDTSQSPFTLPQGERQRRRWRDTAPEGSQPASPPALPDNPPTQVSPPAPDAPDVSPAPAPMQPRARARTRSSR